MRTVRLTNEEFRAWRDNHAQWVSSDGRVLRAVTEGEEAALFPAIERAKIIGRSGTQTLMVDYGSEVRPLGVEYRATSSGKGGEKPLVETFVRLVGPDGQPVVARYTAGRAVLKARLLQRHGEHVLFANGRRLTVVRDPTVVRPKYALGRTSAPASSCVCQGWVGTEAGKHHELCEHNRTAPPSERSRTAAERARDEAANRLASPSAGDSSGDYLPADAAPLPAPAAPQPAPGAGVGGPTSPTSAPYTTAPVYSPSPVEGRPRTAAYLPAPPVPGAQVMSPPVSPVAEMVDAPSPEQCDNDCRGLVSGTRGWEYPARRAPEKGQHHPMCKHYSLWRQKTLNERQKMVFDFASSQEVRPATPDEIAESEVSARRTGVPSIEIAGQRYAVVDAGSTRSPRKLAEVQRMGETGPKLVMDGTRLKRAEPISVAHDGRLVRPGSTASVVSDMTGALAGLEQPPARGIGFKEPELAPPPAPQTPAPVQTTIAPPPKPSLPADTGPAPQPQLPTPAPAAPTPAPAAPTPAPAAPTPAPAAPDDSVPETLPPPPPPSGEPSAPPPPAAQDPELLYPAFVD